MQGGKGKEKHAKSEGKAERQKAKEEERGELRDKAKPGR